MNVKSLIWNCSTVLAAAASLSACVVTNPQVDVSERAVVDRQTDTFQAEVRVWVDGALHDGQGQDADTNEPWYTLDDEADDGTSEPAPANLQVLIVSESRGVIFGLAAPSTDAVYTLRPEGGSVQDTWTGQIDRQQNLALLQHQPDMSGCPTNQTCELVYFVEGFYMNENARIRVDVEANFAVEGSFNGDLGVGSRGVLRIELDILE